MKDRLEKIELLKELSVNTLLDYNGKMTLSELISCFETEINSLKGASPQYEEIKFEFETEYGYYNECSYQVKFYGFRMESDEEFEKRKEDNKKRVEAAKKAAITKKEAKEKREKTLWENLKKKFGA